MSEANRFLITIDLMGTLEALDICNFNRRVTMRKNRDIKFEEFFAATYKVRRTIFKDVVNEVLIKSSGKDFARRLFIYTPYNADFVAAIKTLKTPIWEPMNCCWSVPVSQKEKLLTLSDKFYNTNFLAKWNLQKSEAPTLFVVRNTA